jgi:RNA polymerase sigma-70 factor (ECF subfamily)
MNDKTNPDATRVLAEQFEAHRSHLRAVAYRMLGSVSEAEDAVQEGWIRLSRTDTSDVNNLGGWLTTVVSRVCLDALRSRRARREDSQDERLPDPIVSTDSASDPETEAMLADAVGLAMLVVLDTLPPAERLAFVLHDMFAVPFTEIAPIVGRSADATKMMASRARKRVQGSGTMPDADLSRQREVVNAFLAAARRGDFEALVAVLDPDVVLRADEVAGLRVVRGATAVASGAILFSKLSPAEHFVVVNGTPGVVASRDGEIFSVAAFTVVNDRIVEIDIVGDPDRLRALGITTR